MTEILRSIWNGFATASLLDQANLVLGLIGVWLMIKRSIWNFPINLVGVTVQGVLFFETKFYADATQQVFYFATLAWGWWHWVHGRGAAAELPVTTLSGRARLLIFLGGSAAVAVWAMGLFLWTDAVMPWRDAFIAVFGILASLLQSQKAIENWAVWMVVNAVAVASYWKADLAYTAFLYALYFVLAVIGWREWLRARGAVVGVAPSETLRN